MKNQDFSLPLMGNPLKEKSFQLALRVIKLGSYLRTEKSEMIISTQIVRSGTSPGAMINEAQFAESGADFIHKLSVARKEVNETLYWLELLYASQYITTEAYQSLHSDTTEILKLLTRSILTKKKNIKKISH